MRIKIGRKGEAEKEKDGDREDEAVAGGERNISTLFVYVMPISLFTRIQKADSFQAHNPATCENLSALLKPLYLK
jgi:hypothetical protein